MVVYQMPKQYGFSKQSRLLSSTDFRHVLSNPDKKLFFDCFVLFLKRNSGSISRLGIAVPKRKIRLAVRRNRIKRISRESFRLHQSLPGYLDIVIIANQKADLAGNKELFTQFDQAWEKSIKYFGNS